MSELDAGEHTRAQLEKLIAVLADFYRSALRL